MFAVRNFARCFAVVLSVAIIPVMTSHALAETGDLYQVHRDGRVWKYTRIPCSDSGCPGWRLIDDRLKPYSVVATRGGVYAIRNNSELRRNEIWQYRDSDPCDSSHCPGWTMLDENPASSEIFAGGGKLYQRHNDGRIWEYTGAPCGAGGCAGWRQVDRGPFELAVGGDVLYERSATEKRVYRLDAQGKHLIDNNPDTQRLATTGEFLFRIVGSGSLGAFTGEPCRQDGDCSRSWQDLGVYGDISIMRAGRRNDYQAAYVLSSGRIKVSSAQSSLNGSTVDNDMHIKNFVVARNQLYKLLDNGDIYAYSDRGPDGCDGEDDCKTDWIRIDANSASDQIVADVE